jgi:RNA polymerase sigma-70 factor (ECF subfamily)
MSKVSPDAVEIQELLRQAGAGNRDAFAKLFARFRSELRRMVALRLDRRLRARVDASDIVQETQLEALRRLPEYLERRPMPFRLWLRKTAQERLLVVQRQHLRAARRTVDREVPLPDRSSLLLAQQLAACDSTPSQRLDRRDLAHRVRQGLARLPEADREILIMRTFEGLSNQEVGHLLDIDPGTASKRHGRALLRLHRILSDSGMTESQL